MRILDPRERPRIAVPTARPSHRDSARRHSPVAGKMQPGRTTHSDRFACATEHVAVFWLLLACAALGSPREVQAQSDPAYVNSPAGRAVPDPARADGGTHRARSSATPAGALPGDGADPATLAQAQALQLQALQLQQAQATESPDRIAGGIPGLPGTTQDAVPQSDIPPAGPGTAPQPGAFRQMQSGLMQDAAGIIDAGIQRQIYGPNGPMRAYSGQAAYPGTPMPLPGMDTDPSR